MAGWQPGSGQQPSASLSTTLLSCFTIKCSNRARVGCCVCALCDIFFNVFLLHPAQALTLFVVRLFSYCSNNDFLFRLAGATFTYDERSASRSGPKAQTAQGARTSPAAKADRLGREEPTAIAKKRV